MNMIFDVDLYWQIVLQDWGAHERRYYAAPLPHLVVLVIRDEAIEELGGGIAGNLHWSQRIYDVSIGWHPAHAPLGFTVPEAYGYRHSKLTVYRAVDAPPDMRLSEFLAGAPTIERPMGARYQLSEGASLQNIWIPDILLFQAQAVCARSYYDMNSLIWAALKEWIENRDLVSE
jgi:hypothetical protein